MDIDKVTGTLKLNNRLEFDVTFVDRKIILSGKHGGVLQYCEFDRWNSGGQISSKIYRLKEKEKRCREEIKELENLQEHIREVRR